MPWRRIARARADSPWRSSPPGIASERRLPRVSTKRAIPRAEGILEDVRLLSHAVHPALADSLGLALVDGWLDITTGVDSGTTVSATVPVPQ